MKRKGSQVSKGSLLEALRRRSHLVTLAVYLCLVLLVFSPLVLNMGGTLLTNTLGVSQDKWHFIWNFWWFKQAAITGQNPYFTNSFYYPNGAPLALQTLDFADAAISLPVAAVFGEIVAYNFIAILSMVLTAFFAYLLAWHLTHSWLGSFAAGTIFAFFPQHIAQLYAGHPNLASLEWLPLYLLFLMLTFETGKFRFAAIAGLALALITYTELELLFMMAITTVVYLAYLAMSQARSFFKGRSILLTGVLLAVWGAITSPFLYEAFRLYLSGGRIPPPLLSVVVNSASPTYYFIPSPYNYLLSGLVRPVYTPSLLLGGAAQWVIFVGWTALALSVLGALLSEDRRRYFFVALALIALYFSLGPSNNQGLNIQTPLTLLYTKVSFLDFFRTPARMSTVVMLAVSCMAAMGVQRLSSQKLSLRLPRLADFRRSVKAPSARGGVSVSGKAVAVVCIGLILLEFVPMVQTSDPAYYVAASVIPSSNQFSVLNIPARVYPNQFYLYQSTLIGTPVVNGKLSQLIQTLPNYMYVEPFFRLLAAPLTSRLYPDPIHQTANRTDTQLAPIIMSLYGMKYVILYRYEYNTRTNFTANLGAHTSWGLVNSTLYSALGAPVYQDNVTTVFELPQFYSLTQILNAADAGPIMLPGEGWGPPGVGGRNITTPAQLLVYSSTTQLFTVSVSYSSPFPNIPIPPLCLLNENSTTIENCGYSNPSGISTVYGIQLVRGLNLVSFVTSTPATVSVHSLEISS